MRAWQVNAAGEPEAVLSEVALDLPEPGPNQVRIKVTAAGIGLPDVLMCRGTYPLTPPLPFTPGQEVTGVVTAVGDGASLAPGDCVMAVSMFWQGSGSFAEECLLDVSSTFAVPDGLSDVDAAGFWIPNMTGWLGLVTRGGIVEGDWLVVLGAAGGSGVAAVQLGHALGAHVIAVVGGEEKAAFCRDLGADVAIDHRGVVGLNDAIREATGGRGADLVFDPVGGEAAESACRALARDGRLLSIGFASGRWPKIPTSELVMSNTSVVGVYAGGYAREELDAIHARLSALVADGHLRHALTGHVGWSELPKALQRLGDRSVIGKQVFVP
jgi:NADPH2:quinone reductase